MSAQPSAVTWTDTDREADFRRWLSEVGPRFGLQIETLAPASADASFRRYLRLAGRDGTLVIMDAPPPLEDVRPFIGVASRIRAAGLNAPEVLAADAERGFLLLTDLGHHLYLTALREATPEHADAMMREATAALLQFQQRVDASGWPVYDEALLARELALFPEWCVQREFGHQWSAAQQQSWDGVCRALIDAALAQPRVPVHRDWMPRNLMVTANGPGILDFQDAVQGPVTYDIVSQLRDAFISWEEPQEIDWAVRWWQGVRAAGLLGEHPMADDFGECWRAIEWMGLQRHLKILGIFCRLKHRDGKPGYSADLPRFFQYAARVAVRYRELKPLIRLIEPMTGPLTSEGYSLR